MKTYFLICWGATFITLLATPLLIRVAQLWNLYDHPGVRKVHNDAIPRIGGVAIVLGMLGIVGPLYFLDNWAGDALRDMGGRLIVMAVGALLMFVVGLIDDLVNLRAKVKLLCQLTVALMVCLCGIRIYVIEVDWFTLHLGWLSWPVTVLWIVAITNAINLVDGLDGLAAGIAAIACAVIAAFALYSAQPVMAVLMLALLGSLCGFLFFNFNPARIFMGDCGSMFLGFVLAVSSLICAAKSATLVGVALPILAMGIPLFDTMFSIVRRLLERRSIFSADRSHFHHRLLDMGLHQSHVVLLIYLLTILVTGLGMFMMATRDSGTVMIFICSLLLLLVMFRVVGAIKLRELWKSLQKNRFIAQQNRRNRREFENAQLLFRQAATFEQWWQAVERAAEDMDFVWVRLPLMNRDGSYRTMLWHRAETTLTENEIIQVTVPLHQRRTSQSLQLLLGISVSSSLEAAGRRIAFFNRLIDEHGLDKLPWHEGQLGRSQVPTISYADEAAASSGRRHYYSRN